MHNVNKAISSALVAAVLLSALSGCAKKPEESAISESVSSEAAPIEQSVSQSVIETSAIPTLSNAEYEAAGINELNSVPILMYHRIYGMTNEETSYTGGNVDADGYNRTSEAFEADLRSFYEQGYRMMRLTDFVDGYIDVPFG